MTTTPIRFNLTERGFQCCYAAMRTVVAAFREFHAAYQRHVAATELDRALQARREKRQVPR